MTKTKVNMVEVLKLRRERELQILEIRKGQVEKTEAHLVAIEEELAKALAGEQAAKGSLAPRPEIRGSVDDPEFRRERAVLASRASRSPESIIKRLISALPDFTGDQLKTVARLIGPMIQEIDND